MTRGFWKNFVALTANNILTPFFSILLVLAISRLHGPEALGRYSLLMAVFVLGQSCASLGLNVLITRETSRTPSLAGPYYFNSSLVSALLVGGVLLAVVPTVRGAIQDIELQLALPAILLALLPSILVQNAEAVLLGFERSEDFVLVALLTEQLRREGGTDNHKRIYRIYREEGLQVRRRKRKRAARWRGERLEEPQGRNEIWAMDFMSDQLANGRRLRVLPIIDIYPRECLAIGGYLAHGRTSGSDSRPITNRSGWPRRIVVDNGPEFRGCVMDRWAYESGVNLHFIEPGKPMQNGYAEGFNSTFRDQCLNEHWFTSIAEAQVLIEQWRQIYNTVKPHSSLDRRTPQEFADSCSGLGRNTSQNQGNCPLNEPGKLSFKWSS